jgi:hypothetical protein
MSDFFSPPPPPPQEEPQRYRTPEWMSAPNGTLPGVVALELVLARNDRVAVCVTRLAAYPTGFEFELVTMTRGDADDEDLNPFLFGPHRRRRGGSPGAARVAAAAGARANGSGRSRPRDRLPSSANGRPPASSSRGARSTRA